MQVVAEGAGEDVRLLGDGGEAVQALLVGLAERCAFERLTSAR
ncbi:hypothetical protein ABZ471_36185 [Streptomyces sp. NPDC005728]